MIPADPYRNLGPATILRADFVLGSLLGEQARVARIRVPAEVLGQLREDG